MNPYPSVLPTSPEIHLLDNHTVNQIAAGEVVERPAAALKELVENALDALADRITIALVDSGRTLIEVADNGHGMTESAARMALLRHATSKINSSDDLLALSSYGFRGEALPSIASVSHLTLSTATADGTRTVITVQDGTIHTPTNEPGPRGTTIRVENLFAAIPARLKFLKSDVTELNQCIEVISRFALLRPDVAFTLTHNDGILLRSTGSGDPLAALADVWTPEVARALVPLSTSNGYAAVSGFVSPPHLTKPTRSMQWLFVNGRPIRSKTLSAALDQAVRSLTPDRRYPIAALFIDVNPAELDVNVSPTKSEVKFHREGAVFDAVRRAVKDALLAHGMVPTVGDIAAVNSALADLQTTFPLAALTTAITPTATPGAVPTSSPHDLLDGLRILGQIDDTFIIAENNTSLLIIDQHVAHERILYEMLLNTRGQTPIERQQLLDPVAMPVGRRLLPLILDHQAEFAAMGFDLEAFGPDSLLVRSVPALGRGRPPLSILQDMVDELADGATTAWTPSRDEVYIMCSCKLAIKAGDPLGHAEMRKLIEDLAETENPYLCPHGRPITIAWPKGDLRRRFKR